MKNQLPKDFLWGAASSAHQVEGGQHNNWSVWEPTVADKLAKDAEHRIKDIVLNWDVVKSDALKPDNYISGLAVDHYNRFKEDFDLLEKIGCNAYRFSIEWSRIEPEPGQYDVKALDHYALVVKDLKRRGITPLVTLHMFTDPAWLEDEGGWHGKKVVEHFKGYSEFVAKRLGSQVEYWATVNEPGSYLLMRYLDGAVWPDWPHKSFKPLQGYKYLRNVVAVHRQAAEAIKRANPQAKICLVHNGVDYQLGRPDPFSWLFKKSLEHIPNTYLLKRLRGNIDFIGVNYYVRVIVKSSFSHPAKWALYIDKSGPRSDAGWEIYPEGLYNVTQAFKKYKLPIIITENGIADASDKKRGPYIKDHVEAIKRSITDGADIRGYFYWSLLESFEWSEGWWPKMGLITVDRKTMKRTLLPSANTYAKIIKQHSACS